MSKAYLFVYGTLMRGGKNRYARLLHARSQFIGEASLRGRLYNLGAYPGAVLGNSGPWRVYGEVFLLHGDGVLESLDRYERCHASDPEPHLFKRYEVSVRLTRGRDLVSWTYLYARSVAGRVTIPAGRFPSR